MLCGERLHAMPAEDSAPRESRAGSGQLLVDRFAVWVGFGADQQQQQQEADREGEAAKATAGSDVGGTGPPLAEAVLVVPKLFGASERRHLLAGEPSESSADRGAGTSDRNRPPPAPPPTKPLPPAVVSAQRAAVPAAEGGVRFDGTYSESGRSTESSVDSFESADGLLCPDGAGGALGFADAEAFTAVETAEAEGAGEFMSIRLGEGSAEGEAVI